MRRRRVVICHDQIWSVQLPDGACDLLEALSVGDDQSRAAVSQPVLESLEAEEDAHRDGDGAQLVDRKVGHRGVQGLGEHDGDAVPGLMPRPLRALASRFESVARSPKV
jgi:hypothetical protein